MIIRLLACRRRIGNEKDFTNELLTAILYLNPDEWIGNYNENKILVSCTTALSSTASSHSDRFSQDTAIFLLDHQLHHNEFISFQLSESFKDMIENKINSWLLGIHHY